jgi:transposase
LPNNERSIEDHFKPISKACKVVMEATGKYHRTAHRVLSEQGFSVMVVNPYQSKHFANALNLKCKTDKVDAKMLAAYADRMDFKPTQCPTKAQEKMQDLLRHLDDLKRLRVELQHRLNDSKGFIAKSLRKTVKGLDEEIKQTQEAIKALVGQDKSLQTNLKLLLSIPGVGELTALSLMAYLKELGTLSKREIASLSGLAPMNHDSGNHKGKRRIKGGRHDANSFIYACTGRSNAAQRKIKAVLQPPSCCKKTQESGINCLYA